MTKAEELLDSLSEDQVMTYIDDPVSEPHIVINSDRTVTVPDELKHIAVKGDHNIETVTFDGPRYWDGHDLSEMKLRIVFQRPDGYRDSHPVENLCIDTVDESVIHFDWTISGNVTAIQGSISFTVCGKLSDAEGVVEREWHTRLNQDLVVDEGMDCSSEEIIEQNPDIIEAILVQLDDIRNTGGVSDEQIANALSAYLEQNPVGSVYYRATDYGISTESEDNTPALQALVNEVSAKGGGIIFFPVGVYDFKRLTSRDYRWAVEMKSNVSIIGENLEKTVFRQTQEIAYSMFGRILDDHGGADDPLTGCTFMNFTVDGYATGNVNHVCGKAFYFQYVRDCVFRDLRLMGTIATAMGIDFLDRVVIDNVSCIDCGRTFTGDESGTSGIGIGTAGWENENFIISNCICNGSGQYGIFIENQGIFYDGNVPYAKGCIISNCIVRNGINKGIGIRGGQNVTVIGCETYENASHGIFIDNNCKNVKVISCSSANNGGAGIVIEPNSTEHLLIKDCAFLRNQGAGIKVLVAAGKNANKLCIQGCYTDCNAVGMDLEAAYLADCVILGNATLDGVSNNTAFTGNAAFNELINADDPAEPVVQSIIIPWSAVSMGWKLMPDGSLTEQSGEASTKDYIDVSVLNDVFELRYEVGDTSTRGAIRIAQYDSEHNSLSDSFGLNGHTSKTDEHYIWEVAKIEGCRYIRIFLSGNFAYLDGELVNAGATGEQ